ncbi:MAG: Gfo/Idh/MocA family oxidoreductase [Treponema sp.]|jgi:predicted dehydrogenase|nr:Gfo/Idh/MocA family oxidoreductase [Treponema sp.]
MIKIGIIGLGWMGCLHAQYLGSIDGCRITALCDKNAAALQKTAEEYQAAAYTEYRDLIADPSVEAVYIVTPQKYHYEIAKAVMAAGKHMLCEKPLALNQKEIDELRVLSRGYSKKIIIDFPQRFSIATQEAVAEIKKGALGDIQFMRCNFRFSMKKHAAIHGAWVFDKTQGGGLILESSVHMWDAVRYMTGQEVESVMAVAHNNGGANFEDSFFCIANLSGGAIACVDMSGWLPENADTDKRFELIGTAGAVYLDEHKNYLSIQSERGVENNPGMFTTGMTHKDVMWHSVIAGGVKRLDEHFIRCIAKDEEPLISLEDGARACEITWSVVKSLESKKLEKVHYGS